jgi:hypothetical protein
VPRQGKKESAGILALRTISGGFSKVTTTCPFNKVAETFLFVSVCHKHVLFACKHDLPADLP